MSDYTKLQTQIEEYQGRAKHLTDKAVEEKRDMTDAEVREHEQLYGKIAATRGIMEQLKDEELESLRELIKVEHKVERVDNPRAANEFFRGMERNGNAREIWHPELRDWTSSSGSSALVIQSWHENYLSALFEDSVARQCGFQVLRTTSTHNVPLLAAVGTAAMKGEMTAYAESDPDMDNVQFAAYKLTLKVDVADEILADSTYDIGGLLSKAVGQSFAYAQDKFFISACGTGSAVDMTPSGIFKLAGDATGASNSGITADELIAMVYGLARHYRKGAAWFMSDTTLGYIARLRATASAVESLLWQDAVSGEPAKLFSYPVWTHSTCSAYTGASSCIISFGKPSMYAIAERGPMEVQRLRLNEYSDTFAFNQRIDGHPITGSAFYNFYTGSA